MDSENRNKPSEVDQTNFDFPLSAYYWKVNEDVLSERALAGLPDPMFVDPRRRRVELPEKKKFYEVETKPTQDSLVDRSNSVIEPNDQKLPEVKSDAIVQSVEPKPSDKKQELINDEVKGNILTEQSHNKVVPITKEKDRALPPPSARNLKSKDLEEKKKPIAISKTKDSESKDQKQNKEQAKSVSRELKKSAEPKSNFASSDRVPSGYVEWLLHFKSSPDEQGRKKAKAEMNTKLNENAEPPKKSKRTEKSVSQIEDHVVLDEKVISETLAALLAQQGHTEQAKQMYQKLARKFPEKSSIFASLIEKL